jgi:hypothetical protein
VRQHRRTLAVAAVVNALLLPLVVWSRPGSTTTVRIVASGNTFRACVDGKLEQTATSAAEPRGGVGFGLPPGDAVPSYPGPSAVRSIRVTDTASGRVLLEHSFERRTGLWHWNSAWVQRGGAIWMRAGGTAVTGYRPWRDYVVEAQLTNVESADVLVRAQANGDGIDFSFRPFREFDSSFLLRKRGELRLIAPVGTTGTDTLETTRSIVAIALRGYRAIALALLAGVTAFALAVALGTRSSVLARLGAALAKIARPVAVVVALTAGASLLAINWVFVRHMPHVPDEVGYLFQAKIFASFHLYGHVPPLADHFAFPGAIIEDHGRWFSQYPFGHPLFLAVGELVHAPWLVPPIVGALTVYCVFRLGEAPLRPADRLARRRPALRLALL